MRILLCLILLSSSLYAQNQDLCIPKVHNPLSDLEDLHKHLEDHGANEEQIGKAFCKNLKPPGPKELDALIRAKSTGSASETVNGVSFHNESPVLIEAFRKFTTAKDIYGVNERPENQKDLIQEFKIGPECTKVRCALEKIWGKGLSEKMLYLNLKHNYNASELAFDKSERFTEEEIDDVLMGINDLPPHLTPTGYENQRLTRFKRGYTLSQYSATTIANAVIMIFDPWDDYGHRKKQYAIFHEVSHNAASKLKDMDTSPEWLAQSSWVKTGDEWQSAPDACSASNYGATNPFEDFAESMSTYRYNPDEFKARCPEKYAFIKNNVFNGTEYTELKTCEAPSQDQLAQLQALAIKSIKGSIKPTKFSENEVSATCTGIFSYPPQKTEQDECSLKLMSTKQVNGTNHISAALNELGLYNSEANQNLVRQGLADKMLQDSNLKEALISKASGVDEAIPVIIEQSIMDVMPKGMGNTEFKTDGWEWYQKDCLKTIFSGVSLNDLTNCHLDKIVKRDKQFQDWSGGHFNSYKMPPIFKEEAKAVLEEKRDSALVKHLSNQEVTKEAMSKVINNAKEQIRRHQSNVSFELVLIKKWKNETPESFCAQTYAMGSSTLELFGSPRNQLNPSIQEWCVKKQSQSNKRFEFSQDEWNSYVETLFK